MACDGSFNQNSIQIWSRVRDGSVLELAVETADGVVSGARVLIDHPSGRTEERLWQDGDLNPGPKRLTLRGGCDYAIRVRVGFTGSGEAEAVVAARIEKPNGEPHGRPYRYCVSGSRGDVERSTISIATRRA